MISGSELSFLCNVQTNSQENDDRNDFIMMILSLCIQSCHKKDLFLANSTVIQDNNSIKYIADTRIF